MRRITIIAAALATAALATTYIQTSSTGYAPWKPVKDSVSQAHLADSALKSDSGRVSHIADSAKRSGWAPLDTAQVQSIVSDSVSHCLPLTAGSGKRLTGTLYGTDFVFDSARFVGINGGLVIRPYPVYDGVWCMYGSAVNPTSKNWSALFSHDGDEASLNGSGFSDLNVAGVQKIAAYSDHAFSTVTFNAPELTVTGGTQKGYLKADGSVDSSGIFSGVIDSSRVAGVSDSSKTQANYIPLAGTSKINGDLTPDSTNHTVNLGSSSSMYNSIYGANVYGFAVMQSPLFRSNSYLVINGTSRGILKANGTVDSSGVFHGVSDSAVAARVADSSKRAESSRRADSASVLNGLSADHYVQGTGYNSGSTYGMRTTWINSNSSTAFSQGLKSGFFDNENTNGQTPNNNWAFLINSAHCNSTAANEYQFQISASFDNNLTSGYGGEGYWMRVVNPAGAGAWRSIIHSGNYASYSNYSSGITTGGTSTLNGIKVFPTAIYSTNAARTMDLSNSTHIWTVAQSSTQTIPNGTVSGETIYVKNAQTGSDLTLSGTINVGSSVVPARQTAILVWNGSSWY